MKLRISYCTTSRPADFLNRRQCKLTLITRLPIDEPLAERPGTVIGRYRLLEQIGEGGFGVVFLAEQQQPVRRRVALKIIKPGMDTREVIARFEAERQALAMMDHPNIAKVLDCGRPSDRWRTPGRPYFVMELVKGVPITEYCDQCNLTTRERLELFVDGLPGGAARPSERASFIATSSQPTCWWRSRTAGPRRR